MKVRSSRPLGTWRNWANGLAVTANGLRFPAWLRASKPSRTTRLFRPPRNSWRAGSNFTTRGRTSTGRSLVADRAAVAPKARAGKSGGASGGAAGTSGGAEPGPSSGALVGQPGAWGGDGGTERAVIDERPPVLSRFHGSVRLDPKRVSRGLYRKFAKRYHARVVFIAAVLPGRTRLSFG